MKVFESLEVRCLLSSVVNGVLKITGTDNADRIDVTLANHRITVNEHNGHPARTFTSASIKSIDADLKAGDDSIRIAEAIHQPATLLGGAGKDTFQGGGGDDFIDGGTSDDTLDYSNRPDGVVIHARAESNGTETAAGGKYHLVEVDHEDFQKVLDEHDKIVGIQRFIGTNDADEFSITSDGSDKSTTKFSRITFDARGGQNDFLSTGIKQLKKYLPPVTYIGGSDIDFVDIQGIPATLRTGGGEDTIFVNPFGTSNTPPILQDVDGGSSKSGNYEDIDSISYFGVLNATLQVPKNIENFTGTPGNEKIIGNSLDNDINGGGGLDIILGGAGNDLLRADGRDNNTLIGGPGNDLYDFFWADFNQPQAAIPHDVVAEKPNEGTDTLAFTFLKGGGLKVDLSSSNGVVASATGIKVSTDTSDGAKNFENVLGTDDNDILIGNAAHNLLKGWNGDDLFFVKDGNKDIVDGGDGNDTAKRDSGLDVLMNVEHVS